MELIKIKARVENFYVDLGDEIITESEAELPTPPGPLPTGDREVSQEIQAWVDEHLFAMTGTGRTKGEATYDLEITESSRPDLVPVGWSFGWGY